VQRLVSVEKIGGFLPGKAPKRPEAPSELLLDCFEMDYCVKGAG
jgi:hypothetical protein